MFSLHIFKMAGEGIASACVIVLGAWLGKRLGRYFASHHE